MNPRDQIGAPLPGALLPSVLLTLLLGSASALDAQSLLGSSISLDRQNAQATAHDFTYLRTPDQVTRFVRDGYLVEVRPTADMDLHQVSFPYARPEARLFVQRLASQYRAACGEKLVVTSLTRPTSNQPVNASSRSVHPTGMAVDLRRSNRAACREWLESTLLSLEREGVVEATRERNPPHYHLAVFPNPYSGYLASITGGETGSPASGTEVRAERVVQRASLGDTGEGGARNHTVARGESLWTIARRYGTDEHALRTANGLTGSRIYVGQELSIPGAPSENVGSAAVVHTVARGESLWTIARSYGSDEALIRAMNGLAGSRILEGQRLEIPVGDIGEAVLRHTVARGESLWTIANRHGTTVDQIRRTNGMDTTRIYAGQVLEVPVTF